MPLPNAGRASIPVPKLRDYLLNPSHPANGGKAEFFTRLGYVRSDWQRLERDIREQHLTQDAVEVQGNLFGRKWKIDAVLNGPLGSGRIITVWFIAFDDDEAAPSFVTAVPNTRVK